MSSRYFESNIHDNLCVVHAINNLIGVKLLSKFQLEQYFKREHIPLSEHFDEKGFDLGAVIRYVQTHYSIHFHLLKKIKKIPHKGLFLISIHKKDYNHMIVSKNGVILDNEEKSPESILEWNKHDYKILDIRRVTVNI